MWVWEGIITPMPGESIEDAAAEAIWLAKRYRAGTKGSKYRYFEMVFNDQKLEIYCNSTVEEVLTEYFNNRYADYKEARRKYGNEPSSPVYQQ